VTNAQAVGLKIIDTLSSDSYINYWSTLMLYTIIVVLVVLWLLGFIANIGGGFIHLLLVIALIMFIWNMIMGRRRGV
jgi:Family of unknown function (DUF5670)